MLLLLCSIPLYLYLVRLLRHRRLNALVAKFQKYYRSERMTPSVAQQIVHESLFYDTPTMMLLGTQIALFKVYGISSVASLLLKTGELKSHVKINKRLADTGILIATSISNPILGPGSGIDEPSSACDPRSAIALARINFLHKKYRISNDDFLYNLALFMIEPIKCTASFDWRPHSPLEVKAIFVLWSELGRRMGIENIWPSYEEMVEWTANYEREKMVPSQASEELAHTAIGHFLDRVPRVLGLRQLVFQLMLTVLDSRTRSAMNLPEPSSRISAIIHGLFKLRAFFVRHLCLPRWRPALWVQLGSEINTDENGIPRMHAVYQRRAGPWYFPEAAGIRLKIQNLFIALGLKDPQKVPGKRWKSEGYRLEELGPIQFEKQGHGEVMKAAATIQGRAIIGPWESVTKDGARQTSVES